MAKKQRRVGKPEANGQRNGSIRALAPDYYKTFKCIGPECEETCCANWAVDIDAPTYQRYRECQDAQLMPMFEKELVEVEKPQQNQQKLAQIKIRSDGSCPFLDADRLCMIQCRLGEPGLSDICALYPRVRNYFGKRVEFGLHFSCPEAARLALLHPEPIRIEVIEFDERFEGRGLVMAHAMADHVSNPELLRVMSDFRKMVKDILQFRKLSLGARVMILGCLLDEVERCANRVPRVRQVLASFARLFVEHASIEEQFCQIPSQLPRKLQVITGFLADFYTFGLPRLGECMRAAMKGWMGEGQEAGAGVNLIERYLHAHEHYYRPYMQEKAYILENYLVTNAHLNMFPFCRGSYLEIYREMVCNLVIIQTILVGMAAYYKGLDDAKVVQLIQSFARSTVHNPDYLKKLTENIGGQHSVSMLDLVWMLKEC